MRRDSIGLVWLKRTTLAGLILLFQTTGKAAAGHGDADDAASCRSLLLNRLDLEVQVGCDLQSIRKRALDLLTSDFFALVQQDFEMRLCEWRASEPHGEKHSDIDQQQEFAADSQLPEATATLAELSQTNDSGTGQLIAAEITATEITAAEIIAAEIISAEMVGNQVVAEEVDTSEISAIEYAVKLRPWGRRFTRDNLLDANGFARTSLAPEIKAEEYRPYDFLEVPESPVLADMSKEPSLVQDEELSICNELSHELLLDPTLVDPTLYEIAVLNSTIVDATVSDSTVSSETLFDQMIKTSAWVAQGFSHALDQGRRQAIRLIDGIDFRAIDFRVRDVLVERVEQATPIWNQMTTSAAGYTQSLANQQWLAAGINLALDRIKSPARQDELTRELPENFDSSLARQDLRKVFGTSVLADPFAADIFIAIKRPPTLVEPLMAEIPFVAEVIEAGIDLIKAEPMARAMGNDAGPVQNPVENSVENLVKAPSENANENTVANTTAYELLVLLQVPSWMVDVVDSNISEVLDSKEIELSKIEQVTPEPKSASLTTENSGHGVSQR